MPNFDAYAGAALTPGGAFQGVSDLVDAIISGQNQKQQLLNQKSQQDFTNNMATKTFGQQVANQLSDNTRQDSTLQETIRHNQATEGIGTLKAGGKKLTVAQAFDAATKRADRELGIDGGEYTTTDKTYDPIFKAETIKVNKHQLNENKALLQQRSDLIEKYSQDYLSNGSGSGAADIVNQVAPPQAVQVPQAPGQGGQVVPRAKVEADAKARGIPVEVLIQKLTAAGIRIQ